MTGPTTPAEARQLIAYDWLDTDHDDRLHAPADSMADRSAVDIVDVGGATVPLACGAVAWTWIPGPFTRIGADRCDGCCEAAGYPPGEGSPKNTDACRALLGLPTDGGPAEGQHGQETP